MRRMIRDRSVEALRTVPPTRSNYLHRSAWNTNQVLNSLSASMVALSASLNRVQDSLTRLTERRVDSWISRRAPNGNVEVCIVSGGERSRWVEISPQAVRGSSVAAVIERIARIPATWDMSSGDGDMSREDGQDGNYSGDVDRRHAVRYIQGVGGAPTTETTERMPTMPRRLDPKSCACGCGQITKSGEFMRGHHTRRRWQLVKSVAAGTEGTEIRGALPNVSAVDAGNELARRGWSLPDTYRHFGVELEIVAISRLAVADAMRAAGVRYSDGSYSTRAGGGIWVIKVDGSLRPNAAQIGRGLSYTFEVVSPPLRGKTGLAAVTRVMNALDAAGIEVNKTCGGHVHHEARDFDVASFATLVNNYRALQTAIDRVLPQSRRSTSNNTYCTAYTANQASYIEQATDVRTMAYRAERYKVLNLTSFAAYGTVEFRQHNGTVNAQKMVNWILFGQALVKASRKGIAILPTESLATVAAALGMSEYSVEFFAGRERELRAA